MQPSRILVIDRHANTTVPHLRALGFNRERTGRRAGKFTHHFPPGEIARAVVLQFKFSLEEAGALCHVEYEGKVFPECTMYCNSARYPHHTEQCIRRRKGK